MHQSVSTFWWILYCIPNIEASNRNHQRAHCLRGPNNCDPDGYAGAAAVQSGAWHPWAIIAQRFIFINSFFVIIPRHFYDIAPLVLDQNAITFCVVRTSYLCCIVTRFCWLALCALHQKLTELLDWAGEKRRNTKTSASLCLYFVFRVSRDARLLRHVMHSVRWRCRRLWRNLGCANERIAFAITY